MGAATQTNIADGTFDWFSGRPDKVATYGYTKRGAAATDYELVVRAGAAVSCSCPNKTYAHGNEPDYQCKHMVGLEAYLNTLKEEDRMEPVTNNGTALATQNGTGPTSLATRPSDDIMEIVITKGDLSKLTPGERVNYYLTTCQSLGLNPLTKPFDYLQLSGKLVLYANKGCTDQLRENKCVSVKFGDKEFDEKLGTYTVTAIASVPSGRTDEEVGTVPFSGLKGEAAANAVMKAHTKAKRRATLSICGLGWIDESEIASIANAHAGAVNIETGEFIDQARDDQGSGNGPNDDEEAAKRLRAATLAEQRSTNDYKVRHANAISALGTLDTPQRTIVLDAMQTKYAIRNINMMLLDELAIVIDKCKALVLGGKDDSPKASEPAPKPSAPEATYRDVPTPPTETAQTTDAPATPPRQYDAGLERIKATTTVNATWPEIWAGKDGLQFFNKWLLHYFGIGSIQAQPLEMLTEVQAALDEAKTLTDPYRISRDRFDAMSDQGGTYTNPVDDEDDPFKDN